MNENRQDVRIKEKKKQAPNLGEGSIGRLLLKLAIPTIIAQLVNLLYNLVDRIYIGHIPGNGDLALTGLGLCFPILMIVGAFANLIGAGGAPRVAIAMGEGDHDRAAKTVGNCLMSLVVVAVILTVVLEFGGEQLLVLFGASSKTLPFALSYFRIYVFGNLFIMFALGMNPFITTQGFTNEAMKTVLVGAISNIVLDPIFIFGLKMGVSGAALATIISQGISALFVLRFLMGPKSRLPITRKNLQLDGKIMLPVLALGISPFVMSATESILNIAFNASLSRYGGDVAVGAMTILASIMQLLMLPVQGLTQGAQPLISYNFGAAKTDRVQKTFRLLMICCVTYTVLFWLAIQLFPGVFVGIFNNDSPQLIAKTIWAARIYFAGAFAFGVLVSVQQTFMALGQAKLSLIIACLRKVILLIPLIYILPALLQDNVFAVFLAEPVADLLSISVAAILFVTHIKKILQRGPLATELDG